MKSISKGSDQLFTLPTWDDSPFKCYQRFIPTNDNRFSNSFKVKFSPYKTPKRTVKSFLPRSDSIVLEVENAPKSYPNKFPHRKNFSVPQGLRPKMIRSRSSTVDKISLFDIENIERLQQLIPSKPTTVNYKFKVYPKLNLDRNSFLVTTRPMERNYRRFIKTRK
jgi:hypothetical protein